MMVAELLPIASELAAALIAVAVRELVYGATLFAIVLALSWLLRGAAPSLRQALWGLVLLRLVLPVDLASPLSARGLTPLVVPAAGSLESGAGVEIVAPGLMPGPGRGPATPAEAPWQLYVAVVWLVGVAVCGLAVSRRRRRYLAMVRDAESVRSPRVVALCRRWERALGLRRQLRVVTSTARHAPFAVGVMSPTVFLPRAVLEHEGPSVLEAVIAHEAAHVRRWDDLTLRFQLVISTLWFFNPLAWRAAAAMRRESERACDELVLARGDLSPVTYARSIIAVLRLGLAGDTVHAPGLGGRLETEKTRLERILKMRHSTRHPARSLYPAPVAAAFALFLLPMAEFEPPRESPATPATVETAERLADRGPQEIVLANPVPGSRVTARFGPMTNPFTGDPADHSGIDLAGPAGVPVLAPADGTVEVATGEYSGGAAYGTVLIIDHGAGVKTLFAHLGRLTVERGARVRRGEQVAEQGATGKVTGPHVHFEVWIDGEVRDPAELVADWRANRR